MNLPPGFFLVTVVWTVLVGCVYGGVLFPQGHQWQYSYHALLRSGTLLPAEAYSQWDLHALLTITSLKDVTIAQLSNFNTSIYNGLRDGVPQDLRPAPIPAEADDLGLPFLIHYAGTKVEGISVKETDALWSVNIKKAIASTLQLNLDNLNNPASFIEEDNIYGKCKGIEYSVVNNTEYMYVRKVIDHGMCLGAAVRDWSSASPFLCPGVDEDPFSTTTTREYTLAVRDYAFELKHVLSNRRLYVQPFHAYSEAHQVYQYQVYQLLSTATAPETTEMPTATLKRSLTYEQNYTDISNGRYYTFKQRSVAEQIDFLLDALVNQLEEQNLDKNVTRLHNQELTMIYYNSFLLNLESLRKLYADISIGTSYQQETKKNVFLELLPQIGTDASINFMKELITKRELKSLISIKMLSVYPFYVRHHSTKLLNDMKVLLTLGDHYDSKLRDTAVLSFATLVFQTYLAGQCTIETLEDYAKEYFNWFTESTSYEKRMLYLQGLDNLQLGSVPNYLTSVIKNNEQSRHIRFLAVWATMLTAHLRPLEIYELHWPILTDRTQHLEMRVAAFTMLFIAQPTRSRLLTLFWYMQAETDPHLYNFFYTTLISLQKTQYPCYKHLGQLASNVIRFLRVPSTRQQWMTGNYILDYRNTERAFGGIVQMFLVGNPVTDSPNVIYLTINNYATGKNLNQVAVYIKLHGIGDRILRDIFYGETDDGLKIDKLIKLLEKSNVKLLSPEVTHIELIVKVQGKSVFCLYMDANKFEKARNELKNIQMLLEHHTNYQSIVLPYIREHMQPSDIGTLVIRGVVSNSIASIRGNFTVNNFDVDGRYYTYTTSFLELYNPISNMWHGVHKSRSLQGRALFNGTLVVNLQKKEIELSEERNGDEYLTVVIHSQSLTYIISNGTHNVLQYHCPHCVGGNVVHGGPRKVNSDLINASFEKFGAKLEASVFDCEKYQDIKSLLLDVYNSHQSNYQIIPIARPLVFAMHVADFITYIPPQGSCGISVNLKPFYNEPTQLVLTSSMPHFGQSSILTDPEKGTDFVGIITLTHRKLPDGPTVQFWNATLACVSKPGKRNINATLTIEHMHASKDRRKLCLNTQLYLPDREADMFSMKPADSTITKLAAVWGKHGNNDASCPEKGASIQATATASITDEQKKIASAADRWPYKECKENAVGHRFTPITMSCYLASKEISTYRKYAADFDFNNMPEWFISIAQKVQSLIGLFQTHSSKNDMISKSSNVKTLIELAATEPVVKLKLNSKEATIDYSGFEFIDNLLINTRFLLQDDLNIYFGLSRVCLITPKYITTLDNKTIQVDEIKMRKKDVLVTADRSEHPKFALFLDGSSNSQDLAFTLHAGLDTITVKPQSKDISVVLNGKPFTEDNENSYITAWRLEDDVILVKTRYGGLGIDVYYTREYMVITIPGFYTGKTGGICSSIKSNLP